jgi:hypothetical protein
MQIKRSLKPLIPRSARLAQIKGSIGALLEHGYELFNIAGADFTFVLAG